MKGQWAGGKGSGRRKNADDKAYADNWDNIFGKTRANVNTRKTEDNNESNSQVQKSRTKR